MNKKVTALFLLFSISGISKAGNPNFEQFIERNYLSPCEHEEILDAKYLSFNKSLSDANRIGKDDYYYTTFYFSDESENVKPSKLECFIQGIDCENMVRINSVSVPSKTLFEIVTNDSENRRELKSINAPMGYGHASVLANVGYLQIEVDAVAGKRSKLSKISEKVSGNYFGGFARKYDATFYCSK